MNNDQNDEQLWRIAKRRAGFKHTLMAYIFVNTFLVAVWYFSSGMNTYFWPKWPIFGWGLGLAFQYLDAYHQGSVFSVESEYEKLKRNRGN